MTRHFFLTLTLTLFIGLMLAGLAPPLSRSAGALSGRILITEVKLGGGNDPKEFVEIYNDSATSYDLSVLTLEYAKPGFAGCGEASWKAAALPSSLVNSKALSGFLAPGQFQIVEISMNDNTAGALRLGALPPQPYVIQDSIGWGADRPCIPSPLAAVPSNGKSLQRPFTSDGKPVVGFPVSIEELITVDDPTPGLTNCPPVGCAVEEPEAEVPEPEPEAEAATDELEPCPEGKFRNPETNRCKNIEQPQTLTPCGPNQERNPETNRCRSTTSSTSTLAPCGPGEERNQETNRCRKIAVTSTILPACQDGYERNPETNRCRKVTAVKGAATSAPSKAAGSSKLNYMLIIGVSAIVFAYAVYEYRKDIVAVYNRLKLYIKRGAK